MDLFFDKEFRALIPPLAEDEYSRLEESLIREGNLVPVVVWKEKHYMVDGHNRYDICNKYAIALKEPTEISFATREDVMLWIINNQLARRNLNKYQVGALILKGKEIEASKAKNRQLSGLKQYKDSVSQTFGERSKTLEVLAKKAGVSDYTLSKVEQIEQRAPELIRARASTGQSTIDGAYKELKVLESLPEGLRSQAVALVETKQVKNFYEARKRVHREEANKIEPPDGKYQVLYADPPWDYNHGTDSHGRADQHYNVMSLEAICNLPINGLADDNAVLFLWVTTPMLEKSLSVVHAWGFEYKTFFVWDKVKHVMGHYSSVRHEVLFLCIKGVYPKQSKTLRDSVISIERSGNHSEKPEEFRQLIEELYPHGNKIELFPRGQTTPPGWERWGYQD
jgi:N6-adenosine-specific RNA methylase IME4